MKQFYVYILSSHSGTLYVGVTSDLLRRLAEHREKLRPGFTSRYDVTRLVYVETFPDGSSAITREKQIKGWRREKKVALVKSMNPEWRDLSREWFAEGA